MEKSKVTVVIEEYTDGRYLTRSINSLKRQTNDNFEVLVLAYGEIDEEVREKYDNIIEVTKEEKNNCLINVIKQIKSEYIMFLSTIMIPASNLIAIMLQYKVEKSEAFYYPNFLVVDHGQYVDWWLEEYSYYGVLYTKEEIISKIKEDDENGNITSWLLQCRNDYEECCISENAYIYRSDNPENFQLKLFELIPAVAQNFNVDKELMLKLSKVYIKQWYQCFLKGDNQVINPLKDFLNVFDDDEEMAIVIARAAGISEKEVFFINKYTDEECRFYCKNVVFFNSTSTVDYLKRVDIGEDTSLSDEMNMEQRLNVISNRLKVIEETVYTTQQPVELSERVVNGYRQGKLGLRTIFKAIRAWFAFKIKGKGEK